MKRTPNTQSNSRQVSVLRSIGVLLLGAGATFGQQYVAVDLTPGNTTGSMANAVSAGVAGGSTMVLGPLNGYVQHASSFAGGGVNDIHPAGWYMSTMLGVNGAQQVGLGLPSAASDASAGTHAALWYGTIASFVDLNPNGYSGSGAYCTTGSLQGGYGVVKTSSGGKVKTTPPNHAMIWFGSAASFNDLNPPKVAESRIYGCSANQQAGYIMPVSPGFTHAAVWSGSASSAVDLQPAAGFVSSVAFGSAAGQEVGYGVTVPSAGGTGHALLWTGNAASIVDLHPAGYTFSTAFATNGTQQVGEADDNAFPRQKHAMVWSGTAASAVDLNQFLPPGFSGAQAMAIDDAGNIAGYANGHAFLWVPVR